MDSELYKIKETIDRLYKQLELKDDVHLESTYDDLGIEFEEIITIEGDPYLTWLKFQAMAAIIRYEIYKDEDDSFVSLEFSMIALMRSCIMNDELNEPQISQVVLLVQDIVRECNEYYERHGVSIPMPDIIKDFGKSKNKYQTIKRKEQEPHQCYLCKNAPANAKGSHLAPHFLIQHFLSYDGSSKRDREIVTEAVFGNLSKDRKWGRNVLPDNIDNVFNDVPQEEKEAVKPSAVTRDDLFCERCEKRFSFIESKYSDYYNKRKECISPAISYLFWLSVFWRLHIGGWCFKFSRKDAEAIRSILDTNIPDNQNDVNKLKPDDSWGTYCYTIARCENTKSELLGLVGNHSSKSPYKLLCGEYEVTLYSNRDKIPAEIKEKYTVNDYHKSEIINVINFIDYWKWKYDLLREIEDNESSSLSDDPTKKLMDIYKGYDLGPNNMLYPFGGEDIDMNALKSNNGMYGLVIPGAIDKFMNFDAVHSFEDPNNVLSAFEEEYGYTKEEIQEMMDYWFGHMKINHFRTEESVERHKKRKTASKIKNAENKKRHKKAKKKR
ncbi:MAG: hypothetical protein LKF48_09795 [Prevotella sp.]|nr:hypothetical protein [Prevotella sp.]MCH4183433.1 hypothetical protein [Prevotella sp.]